MSGRKLVILELLVGRSRFVRLEHHCLNWESPLVCSLVATPPFPFVPFVSNAAPAFILGVCATLNLVDNIAEHAVLRLGDHWWQCAISAAAESLRTNETGNQLAGQCFSFHVSYAVLAFRPFLCLNKQSWINMWISNTLALNTFFIKAIVEYNFYYISCASLIITSNFLCLKFTL